MSKVVVTADARLSAGRQQRGSTLLEFAIVTILVLTLMFVIVDFARAAFAYHFVSEAAREATRYASVRGKSWSSSCTTAQQLACEVSTPTQVETYVQSIMPSAIYVNGSATSTQPGYFDVASTWLTNNTGCPGTAGQPGCAVQVTVSYTFGFSLPLLNYRTVPITSTSQMVISQ